MHRDSVDKKNQTGN